MDTLFEVHIGSAVIAGDVKSLYLFMNNNLIAKAGYSEIKAFVGFFDTKIKQIKNSPQFKAIVDTLKNSE